MIRKIIAVIAGFLAYGFLSVSLTSLQAKVLFTTHFSDELMTDHAGILLLNLVLSFGYSVASGFICALVARQPARGPVNALAGLQLVTGILVQAGYWNDMPLWYHLPFLLAIVPFVLLGARLRRAGLPAAIPAPG